MFDTMAKFHWHLSNKLKYPKTHSKLYELKVQNKLNPNHWKDQISRRLRQLIVFCGVHVPYYRDIFKERNFRAESEELPIALEKLPILTKDIVRERGKGFNRGRSQLCSLD